MKCLFCEIGSGNLESLTLYEDEYVRVFLDIHPLTLGHTIIIPKNHVVDITNLDDDLVRPVFIAVKRVTKLLTDKLGVGDFTIGINHGRMLGHPDIDHMHIHVIPRYGDDGGGDLHSIVRHPPEEGIEETYKKIKGVNV